jgi:hypothetical protein
MANPPPPYDDITGISRTVMKDNAQESITNYNGNARPGEIVVNLLNNDVYIGNTSGNLNLLVIGGGSGNSEPAGPVGAIQYNSGGNLFGGTANVVVSGTGISVVGNITGSNLTMSGISNLNSNANVKITGGSAGQSLTTDGTGNLSWTTVSAVTPAYGQFWSNVTQTVALPQTEYRFAFNNSDLTSNVTLGTGASNSRIIINQTGIYNIQFSAQVDKAPVGSSTSSAYVWFKKNGTAVPDSAGFSTLDNAVQDVLTWNILANVANVGDYYEIAYAATHTYVSFPTIPGNVTIGYPASPSIIVTITPVDVNN